MELNYEVLKKAVQGATAFRCVTEYQPAGGPGDKIFPPTYEGGKYATEKRRLPGEAEPVNCVLLDSVQSQANRMELALLEAWEKAKHDADVGKRFPLPVITVAFPDDAGLQKVLRITSLEAPHRIADALLRDSLYEGLPFRKSTLGKRLDAMDVRNATALFEACPTALIFGLWDSTGPKGGLGAKFQRTLVSEIIGIGATTGVKTSSRIDPAQILKQAGPLYHQANSGDCNWTLDEARAARDGKRALMKLGKDGKGKPSEANHGNVTPTIAEGGVTISKALQTTVISLSALRRLRFPLGSGSPTADESAHAVLGALALCAATLTRAQGCDLRSRCLLVPTGNYQWELIGSSGEQFQSFVLNGEAAVQLFREAVGKAREAGLPWMDNEMTLTPSKELVALVKKSQELAVEVGETEEAGA